jgi:prepilin-type N-terminal cleavage/methylation domain-containing protein
MKNLAITKYQPSKYAVSCQGEVPKNVTYNSYSKEHRGVKVMKKEKQSGFSLIELLVVVTIIGIVASLAIPFLQKAIRASENGNTFASLRTVASTQLGYYQSNSRFGRITEINNLMSNAIGTNSGSQVNRGKFIITDVGSPTDTFLRGRYTILATRSVVGEGQTYQYQIDESGQIVQLQP